MLKETAYNAANYFSPWEGKVNLISVKEVEQMVTLSNINTRTDSKNNCKIRF